MKNFKLLLATTAILSTGALMVNATSNMESAYGKLKIYATLVKPLVITQNDWLGFGIITGHKGKKVIVETDGTLGTESDNIVVAQKSTSQMTSFQAGKLTISGTDFSSMSQESLSAFDINFENEVTLSFSDSHGTTYCGTVSDFKKDLSVLGSDLIVKVGAQFIVGNDTDYTIGNPLPCEGETTVTLIQKY